MKPVVVHVLLGIAIGWPLAKRYGLARARAQRAWNDLVATKQAIRGLIQRLVYEWKQTFAAVGLLVLVLLVAGALLLRR